MSETIKIDFIEAYNELDKLDSAISSFQPYTKKFLNNAIDSLNSFNSDFIERLKGTFTDMKDNSDPKMLSEIKKFSENFRKAVQAIEQADVEVSAKVEGD